MVPYKPAFDCTCIYTCFYVPVCSNPHFHGAHTTALQRVKRPVGGNDTFGAATRYLVVLVQETVADLMGESYCFS